MELQAHACAASTLACSHHIGIRLTRFHDSVVEVYRWTKTAGALPYYKYPVSGVIASRSGSRRPLKVPHLCIVGGTTSPRMTPR